MNADRCLHVKGDQGDQEMIGVIKFSAPKAQCAVAWVFNPGKNVEMQCDFRSICFKEAWFAYKMDGDSKNHQFMHGESS